MRTRARILATILVLLLPATGIWLEGRAVVGHMLLAIGWPSASASLFDDPAWRGAALYAARRWQEAADAFGPGAANAYNRGNALARAGRYAEALAAYEAALDADPDNADAVFNKSLIADLLAQAPDGSDGVSAVLVNSPATDRRQGVKVPSADGQVTGAGTGFAGTQEGSPARGPEGGSKVGQVGKGEQKSSDSGTGKATGSASDADGAGRNGGVMVDVAAIIQARNRRIARMMELRSVEPTAQWLATLPDDPGQFLKLRILAEQARRKEHPATNQRDDD
jgi:Ca-activated chloride channel family protein